MVKVISDTEPTVRLSARKDEISAFVCGAAVGGLIWLLSYILNEYVIRIIACQSGSSLISCSDSPTVSAACALIIASVVGLTLLVRRRIFRPLLVVLAAAITLWGITGSWLAEYSFIDFLLTAIITGLVYLVFAWFAKVRQFWIAAVITVVLIFLFRLMITL